MTLELTKGNIVVSASSLAIGLVSGICIDKFHQMRNTPEEVTRNLNEATLQNKASKKELEKQTSENRKVLNDIRSTKKAYQDEIRPEIESKVRKELEDYISKADSTYEKAKRENEMASLRLELAKQYRRMSE